MEARIGIGVVGAGTMGRGIALVFARAGHPVVCHDAHPGAAAAAVDHVLGMLQRDVDKGRLHPDAMARIRGSLRVAPELQSLDVCGVIIEAIVEDLETKCDLFRRLEAVVGPKVVLATNTSSLSVSAIAAACSEPARVAGLHFFNPAPVMKVAEVVSAVRTAPETVQLLASITEGVGHRAVLAVDQPGFLVNHAGRGLYTEGLRLVEEQVAKPHEVDDILREGMGFRMGPFELMDLTGLDVSAKVMSSIYEQFQHEPRFRPSSLVVPRLAAGLLGRKTGEGWYAYREGRPLRTVPAAPPAPHTGLRIWVDPKSEHAPALIALAGSAGLAQAAHAEAADVIVVQPWGHDATQAAVRQHLEPEKTVAVDPLTPFERRRTLMLTAVTRPAVRDAAHGLLASDGVGVTVVNDSAGFVAQRVMATIVNIAAEIVQRGICAVPDLEASVMLGLGYPHGPLEWGDRIGAPRILQILRARHESTGDPRYRPSPWLVRRVALRRPLTTPEASR